MAVEKFEDVCSGTFLLTIDGPISAGKTTLGSMMRRRSPSRVDFLEETGHAGGMVDLFLENPQKYGAVFQMLMHGLCYGRHETAIARLERLQAKAKKLVCVIDRTLIGNMVFAVTSHRLGNIDDTSYAMYLRQNEQMRKNLRRDADLNVYLWVDPDVCVRRNEKRNSSKETSESELECEKYDTSYFWEVEKSAFVALLSDLTVGRGRRPLVLDWHESDRDVALANFDQVLGGYIEAGQLETQVTLSYDKPRMDGDMAYTHTFDYGDLRSNEEFFSREVISAVMPAFAYTSTYDGVRNVHIRIPNCLKSDGFSGLFTLKID